MRDVTALNATDLQGLSKGAITEIAAALLARLAAQQTVLTANDEHIARRDREIRFNDAKIERITFELARLKAWSFGAKTEAMNAEQRKLFEETLAGDQRKPRRQALPEHLRRTEHHHELENTTCPTPDCGQAMVRIGEDVGERLDVAPAEFFVHRHIRCKWACRCCQRLVQVLVEPQIIDRGVPTAARIAHTMVAHFVDHLPYYRLKQINARSG